MPSLSIHRTRLANLRALCRRYPSQAEFARAIGTDDSTLSRYLNQGRGIGNEFAHKIETALGLANGWMDHPHNAATPAALLAKMEAFVGSNPPDEVVNAIAVLLEALTPQQRD